jgi:hypothetical protein
MKSLVLFALTLLIMPACLQAQDNRLIKKERREGWELLFDGRTTKGWHSYRQTNVGAAWTVKDNALHLDPAAKEGRGDIVTDAIYDNYEFRFTWKIAAKGNSGIIFMVQELPEIGYTFQSGPEYQLIDNVNYPDKLDAKQMSGSLYDLIACPAEFCKPAGQWNEGAIIVDHGRIKLELNGKVAVDVAMGSQAWNDALAPSKFATMTTFAKVQAGRIALQDHSGVVWVKNMRIRKL